MLRAKLAKKAKEKQIFRDQYKEKANALLLTKKRSQITWPSSTNSTNAAIATGKYILSKGKKRIRRYIPVSYDPSMNGSENDMAEYNFKAHNKRRLIRQQEEKDAIDLFINSFLAKLRGAEERNISQIINDNTLDLLDNLLLSIANSQVPQQEKTKTKTVDWEFVISHLLQQKDFPKSVIDRVQKQMESLTAKEATAITAMNVTRPPILDLALPTVEDDMQKEIQRTNSDYPEIEDDEESEDPFKKDVKWLMELADKDHQDQDNEIQLIYADFTNAALNLKPVFFY